MQSNKMRNVIVVFSDGMGPNRLNFFDFLRTLIINFDTLCYIIFSLLKANPFSQWLVIHFNINNSVVFYLLTIKRFQLFFQEKGLDKLKKLNCSGTKPLERYLRFSSVQTLVFNNQKSCGRGVKGAKLRNLASDI